MHFFIDGYDYLVSEKIDKVLSTVFEKDMIDLMNGTYDEMKLSIGISRETNEGNLQFAKEQLSNLSALT